MSKEHAPAGGAQSVPSASLCRRRIAKRDSARRVRARNKDMLSSLCHESKQLGSSNEGLTQELALTDAELSELQQQLSATRAQTFNMRCRGDQLSQEVSMLLRSIHSYVMMSPSCTGKDGKQVKVCSPLVVYIPDECWSDVPEREA